MVIGLGVVLYYIWTAAKGRFTNGNDQPVELLGLYWHFVDIVWVFLFPLLYLIAAPHGFHN
jgi:cytochrome c oxidase subunit 3